VHIDEQWVAKEYLERTKKNKWNENDDKEDMEFANLEQAIRADENGEEPPPEIVSVDDLP